MGRLVMPCDAPPFALGHVRSRELRLMGRRLVMQASSTGDDRLSPWVMSDPVNYELMGRLGPVRLEMTYVRYRDGLLPCTGSSQLMGDVGLDSHWPVELASRT
jgi:hypothetical protein